jgi:hypothetical protein
VAAAAAAMRVPHPSRQDAVDLKAHLLLCARVTAPGGLKASLRAAQGRQYGVWAIWLNVRVGGAVRRDEKGGVQLLEARWCPRIVCANDIFAVATVRRALIGGNGGDAWWGARAR